jgi:hypothetical protein
MSSTTPSGGTSLTLGQPAEPSDLAVAIRVGQKMLAAYGSVGHGEILAYAEAHGGLTEALRILLRALGAELVDEQDPAETRTPIGPGCGARSTVRFEGYSPRDGLAHGSLDLAVYACDEHASQARTQWLDELLPYRTTTAGTARCGERFDFTTLGGGQ